ncbi:fumarylacetoacetate hydrolase family protein, partial [Escherichia coli]|uniref:fumarylacetoacetate hydrolase family protein n=1 Tax=Escherichia coli TaxID=562 RepID=UPI00278C15AF
PTSKVIWQPVIPNPDKILCVGLNYETHRKETGRAEVEHPTIFPRYANSQTGHLQPIVRPRVSTHLDFEGELAVIIGKAGRYISRADAMDHVVGYSCYNDGSIRDFQRHTSQFTPGKNFADTGAFGPWMMTP